MLEACGGVGWSETIKDIVSHSGCDKNRSHARHARQHSPTEDSSPTNVNHTQNITVVSEILKMTERGDIWKKWQFAPLSAATISLCAATLALNQMSSYSAIMPRKHFLITPNELLMRSRLILMGTCGACRFLLHYGSTWTPVAILAIRFSQLLVNWANFFPDSKQLVFLGHYVTFRKSTKHRDITAHPPFILNILSGVWPAATHKAEKHCIQSKVRVAIMQGF